MDDQQDNAARELRTPVSAALAGIAFAAIVTVAVVLLRSAIPHPGRSSVWLDDASQRHALATALDLIPYAGIAFLWFIGVIRFRLGDQEDKLFSTAFLGSGLLFVAMLFTAAAVMGGLLGSLGGSHPVSDDSARLATAQTAVLVGTLGIRMAAVFTTVVTNLGRRTGIVPTWLVVAGYAAGVVLLLAPPTTIWVALIFPAWVFTLSVQILVTSLRSRGS